MRRKAGIYGIQSLPVRKRKRVVYLGALFFEVTGGDYPNGDAPSKITRSGVRGKGGIYPLGGYPLWGLLTW